MNEAISREADFFVAPARCRALTLRLNQRCDPTQEPDNPRLRSQRVTFFFLEAVARYHRAIIAVHHTVLFHSRFA